MSNTLEWKLSINANIAESRCFGGYSSSYTHIITKAIFFIQLHAIIHCNKTIIMKTSWRLAFIKNVKNTFKFNLPYFLLKLSESQFSTSHIYTYKLFITQVLLFIQLSGQLHGVGAPWSWPPYPINSDPPPPLGLRGLGGRPPTVFLWNSKSDPHPNQKLIGSIDNYLFAIMHLIM